MSFWSKWVDALPDEHLQTLFAHELAHVYLFAIGDASHMDATREYEDREMNLCDLLLNWGFDEDAYDEYVHAHLSHMKRETD